MNTEERTSEELARLEWLVPNGLGGWASGTVLGANTRRYHGVFVPSLDSPIDRYVYLSSLGEVVSVGSERYELGTRAFSETLHPEGYRFLKEFTRHPLPTWRYEIPLQSGDSIELKKSICCPLGENITLIQYEAAEGGPSFQFRLEPFIAARFFHYLHSAEELRVIDTSVHKRGVRFDLWKNLPALELGLDSASFEEGHEWHYRFFLERERERGYDFEEDCLRFGALSREVKGGESFLFSASLKPLSEKKRRKLFAESAAAGHGGDVPLHEKLTAAGEAFIVKRGKDETILAGYPWFGDWGRDTMISLPGLCLLPGRYKQAKRIMRSFLSVLDRGMIPNRFREQGEPPQYNSVDATLWLAVAGYRYYLASGDKKFVKKELYPALQEIIQAFDSGTRFGIQTEPNHLLSSGEPRVQLTWMDAMFDGVVVTPRSGKPVEINALWLNLLWIAARFASLLEKQQEERTQLERVREGAAAFIEVFWSEELGHLRDVAGGGADGSELRPNQAIALSLPLHLVSEEIGQRAISAVRSKLFTPLGLRTLDPDHPDYHPRYEGDQRKRDFAYHQGTVWAWLHGPYFKALDRYCPELFEQDYRRFESAAEAHLNEAGLGSVSEIFDAEPPHTPRGAPFQAWSVACWNEVVHLNTLRKKPSGPAAQN